MTTALPDESGATEFETVVEGLEVVFVAMASQPPLNTQIISVHQTLEGANQRLEDLGAAWGVDHRSVGIVERVPLEP